MYLGWREMRNSPGRYWGVVTLITLIAYLVFFLTGLAYGLAQANRSALDAFDAKGMVISRYANSSVAASRVNPSVLSDVTGVGRQDVVPVFMTQAVATANDGAGHNRNDGKEFTVALIGFDDWSAFLAPKVLEGSVVNVDGEAVVTKTFASAYGVRIGDTIGIAQSQTSLRVVGVAPEAQYSISPVIYTRLRDAQMAQAGVAALMQRQDKTGGAVTGNKPLITGFVLGKSVSPKVIEAADSARYPGIMYLDMKSVIWSLPGYVAQIYTFGLMIGFLVVICAIVIGVFMYIMTMQKKPVFGVMKAQGIPSRYISVAVLWQTVLVTWAGLGIGLVTTFFTSLLLPEAVPYRANWSFVAVTALTIFIVAALGAQISVRQVSKIDPLEAMNR